MAPRVSFSEEVREELASAPLPERDCCRHALLSGADPHRRLLPPARARRDPRRGGAAGRPARRGAPSSCCGCSARRARSARTASARFQSGQRVEISCAGDARDAGGAGRGRGSCRLARAGRAAAARLLARGHCRGAYLRGAFLAAGTVAPPRRPAHLEIRTHDADAPRSSPGSPAGMGSRCACGSAHRTRPCTRSGSRRSRTCSRTSAPSDGVLRLMEGEVVSPARRSANRQANAETANLRRQVVAARRQLSAIGLLDVAALPPELAAAAALRIEHPELPLAELAVLGDLSKADAGRSAAAARGARRGRVSRVRWRLRREVRGMLSGGASPSDRLRSTP